MMNSKEYFVEGYIPKSRDFLFPLISKKNNREFQKNVLGTYLFAEDLQEKNIINYYLLCEIVKNTELDEGLKKYLKEVYLTEDDTELCIFCMKDFKNTIDMFLAGSYSEYDEKDKKIVLESYGFTKTDKTAYTPEDVKKENFKGVNKYLYVVFYPNKFRKEIAEYYSNCKNLFDNEKEALSVLKEVKEFCQIYDLEKETYVKKLIK